MMETAYIWAKESYCVRAQVGAILAKDGRILSTGYNGTITGSDNCCEIPCSVCNGKKKKMKSCTRCQGSGLNSKTSVVHAEANAIAFAGKYGIKTKGCTMYVTLSPCIECSKIMMQHGIKEVYYSKSYRGDLGAKFLKENGVKVKRIKP